MTQNKDLICGCGFEAIVHSCVRKSLACGKEYWVKCGNCLIETDFYSTPDLAIAAFRLATRADIIEKILAELLPSQQNRIRKDLNLLKSKPIAEKAELDLVENKIKSLDKPKCETCGGR